MRKYARVFPWAGSLLFLAGLILPARVALAQRGEQAAGLAILGGVLLFVLVIFAVFYVYGAVTLQTIAKKTGTENAWWAWVPVLNLVLFVNIAKKPVWWFILFFVPLVGLVIGIIVGMEVAKARGKPSWWGILLMIPPLNLIALGYLAWAS